MILEVEKPLLELERKIRELQEVDRAAGVDLSAEIRLLERKAQELKEEYDGMKQDLQELYAEWEDLAG